MANNPPASSRSSARGKGLLVTGIVLLVLGIVAIVLGIVVTRGAANELTSTQIGAAQATPADFTAPLNAATTYAVYEAKDAGGKVQPTDISVTADDGTALTVTKTGDEVVATGAGGTQFVEVATFTIGTSGDFTIKVATADSQIAVAPALSTASKGVAWIAAVILGGLLALVGIVLLIVGAMRRSSAVQ